MSLSSPNDAILGYCAAHLTTVCVDPASEFDDGTAALKSAHDSGDGLHPSSAGGRGLAELVAAAVAAR